MYNVQIKSNLIYLFWFFQFLLIRMVSFQAISLAALIMMIVALIFIPNSWCSLWVAFSIISIEVGVIGYMTLWNVNLDSISMINLIMCIGFSVDFSAHISYAYLTAKVSTKEERLQECLYSLGLPILQGALSTILGVSALVMAPSYLFVTFFKTVFLVIFFGAIHGLLLLPVLLSFFGPDSKIEEKEETYVIPIDFSKRTFDSGRVLNSSMLPRYGSVKPCPPPVTEVIEEDLGIGTSEESSNNSSLSKATSGCNRKKKSNGIKAYSNEAFIYPEEDEGSSCSTYN